jgi:hypothetical protein
MAIDEGTCVRVIKVAGSRVVVRAVDDAEFDGANSDNADSDSAGPNGPGGPASELDRPIDSLGLDPFEDPLA